MRFLRTEEDTMLKTFISLLCIGVLGLCLSSVVLAAESGPQPPLLAHYRFNGDATDEIKGNPDFELKNTAFKQNALYLNGQYEFGAEQKGYRAVCKTPQLNFSAFTVVIRFKTEAFSQQKNNLFTGGTSARWFGLNRSQTGNLTVTLNNQEFSQEIPKAAISKEKWTPVACGMDVAEHKIVAYLNGKKAAVIDLPKSFKFDIDKDAEDNDKVWSFTNYSNASVFHGLVDEVIIYGKLLSSKEFEQLSVTPKKKTSAPSLL